MADGQRAGFGRRQPDGFSDVGCKLLYLPDSGYFRHNLFGVSPCITRRRELLGHLRRLGGGCIGRRDQRGGDLLGHDDSHLHHRAFPASLSVAAGSSATDTITVTGQNGFTGNVTLAATGLPTAVTAAFGTNPTTGSSVVTFTAASTATAGTSTITITGTSGTLSKTTTIALTVAAAGSYTINGLSANGLILSIGSQTVSPASGANSFTFPTPVASGTNYTVIVQTLPTGENCSISSDGSGMVGSSNVTSVVVACVSAYTIGGTVSGLTGGGLILQNNLGDNLSISANGSFTFSTGVTVDGTYSVTVLDQPTTPDQNCTAEFTSGTTTANVTNVQVVCSGDWVWMGGSDLANSTGNYGSPGTASSGNAPPARSGAASWTDTSGNFWLFAGFGEATYYGGNLDDLWKFNPTTGTSGAWTWVVATARGSREGVSSAFGISAKLTAQTPNQKRKSMSFRSGQSGTVVRKGQMWHGRYYVDDPGTDKRRRASVLIGPLKEMTKTEAKRKLRSMLEQMGLNDDDHLVRLEADVKTFAPVAEWWRENKLSVFKPSTQENMGDQIDRYLLPRFGALTMSAITEERAQEFIAHLCKTKYTRICKGGKEMKKLLSPKSVCNIVKLLTQILGRKHCSTWELRFPEVPLKVQRYLTTDEMRLVVNAATGQWKVLWATLAGTGIRISEAIGLQVEDVDLKAGCVIIRRSDWKGQEITPKSKRGYRVASIDPVLVEMLKAHIGKRTSGRLFCTGNKTPLGRRNVNRNLYATLKQLGIPKAGPHAFRHGRVSVLAANGVPQKLQEEWVGHSSFRITGRYTHFDDSYRQKMASESALFVADGPNGPNSEGVLQPVEVVG